MANPNAKITVSLVDKTKAGFASIKKATAGARSALNKVGLAATAAAGGFAVELRHQRVWVHAHGNGVGDRKSVV